MRRRKLYVVILALVGAIALIVALGATAARGPGKAKKNGRHSVKHTQLLSESALLTGLSAQALYPFLDTTPNHVKRAHIAITDATTNCSAGAAAPASIRVLVGQAGVSLVNVMTAATNTGIGTPAQCVFHVTVMPGQGGVPSPVTDIVVQNAGGAPLTGINTVTASASVRTVR